jgi:hypothetical protein
MEVRLNETLWKTIEKITQKNERETRNNIKRNNDHVGS